MDNTPTPTRGGNPGTVAPGQDGGVRNGWVCKRETCPDRNPHLRSYAAGDIREMVEYHLRTHHPGEEEPTWIQRLLDYRTTRGSPAGLETGMTARQIRNAVIESVGVAEWERLTDAEAEELLAGAGYFSALAAEREARR